uniref:Uncharacterized protein n=1 Tax=Micrurus carvalhoi TaxID=3147026 RepID=A0A2H6N8K9_9SAUR
MSVKCYTWCIDYLSNFVLSNIWSNNHAIINEECINYFSDKNLRMHISSFSNSFIENYIKQIHKERKPPTLSPTSIMKINNLSIFLKGKPMNSSSYSSLHSL